MGKEVYGSIKLGNNITMETITEVGRKFVFLYDNGKNAIQCTTFIAIDNFDKKKYVGKILTNKGTLSLIESDNSRSLIAALETVYQI